jgi:hypothetical protein
MRMGDPNDVSDRRSAQTTGPLPSLKITSVRQVFHNGEHNAFTDLCAFQGRLYLTFRSCPDGHMVHPTSSIIVLASDDGDRWEPVFRFRVPERDVRDPHFLVFRGRLFVLTGTWYCGARSPDPAEYEMNQHLGYGAWTDDGRRWHGPRMLEGTYGHYIWRAATFGGRAYLCGRRKREFAHTSTRSAAWPLVESAMLVSDDGLVWRTEALFQRAYGDETAFLFESDGEVLAVVRRLRDPDRAPSAPEPTAQLCRSRSPYETWERLDLGHYVGGPLLARWGGRTLVGGRARTPDGPRTALHWLAGDELHPVATLPSGGDTSYPGFVPLSDDQGLVSYYSSHETDDGGEPITAIYLARVEVG